MELQEGESAKENGEDTYSAQAFVREALQIKITPMMLDQFASEWAEMLRQQNAQNAEVEQLRSINKKLSNQVRHLESSLAQINQEHCELVKQVVATRLEKEELEDELVRVKMALAQESLVRSQHWQMEHSLTAPPMCNLADFPPLLLLRSVSFARQGAAPLRPEAHTRLSAATVAHQHREARRTAETRRRPRYPMREVELLPLAPLGLRVVPISTGTPLCHNIILMRRTSREDLTACSL